MSGLGPLTPTNIGQQAAASLNPGQLASLLGLGQSPLTSAAIAAAQGQPATMAIPGAPQGTPAGLTSYVSDPAQRQGMMIQNALAQGMLGTEPVAHDPWYHESSMEGR
jgi:hypothetical protein